MFTIKFFRFYTDGTRSETVISCTHYEVYRRNTPGSPTTVTTYNGFTTRAGVDRHVSASDEDFDACFIENSAGKTIDSIRPDTP